jgi:uncharacterized repeat protein (TIGR02543 family)
MPLSPLEERVLVTEALSVDNNRDWNGAQVLTSSQLTQLAQNRPFYERAAALHNVPWEIIAAIHFRETRFLRSGPPNRQGPFQIYGGNYPVGTYTDAQFQDATNFAASFIRGKAGSRNLTLSENVKFTFFAYNGQASVYIEQARRLGFSDTEARRGEGSPFVMNRADARRDPTVEPTRSNGTWGQIRRDNGPIEFPSNSDHGAYVVYRIIRGLPPVSTPTPQLNGVTWDVDPRVDLTLTGSANFSAFGNGRLNVHCDTCAYTTSAFLVRDREITCPTRSNTIIESVPASELSRHIGHTIGANVSLGGVAGERITFRVGTPPTAPILNAPPATARVDQGITFGGTTNASYSRRFNAWCDTCDVFILHDVAMNSNNFTLTTSDLQYHVGCTVGVTFNHVNADGLRTASTRRTFRVENPPTATPLTLSLNTPATVTIASGVAREVRFTAPSAGTYRFESSNRGSLDPTARDLSGGVINDDISETDRNYRFERTLTSGQTFTFLSGIWSGTASGSYTVTVTSVTAPTADRVITFDPNGGTVSPTTRTVANNSVLALPPLPTRAGHRFEGWRDSQGNFITNTNNNFVGSAPRVTANMTLTAQWIGVTLDPATNHTFPTATSGYAAQTGRSVTIRNTGALHETGALTVSLSGTNASSFQLRTASGTWQSGGANLSLTSIPGNNSTTTRTFEVRPQTGLAAGTHTATVNVVGTNNVPVRSFTVNFTVNSAAVPTTPITLSLNTPTTVTITSGVAREVRFTAPSAGTYRFESSNRGSLDPIARTSASGETVIDDDSAGNLNYRFERTMTSGQTFTFWSGVFNNSGSGSYTVTVTAVPPNITSQPVNRTVTAGQTATFSATATGNPTPTFQWQVSTNGGTSWANVSGGTSATLNVSNTTATMSGNRYRVIVTNTGGSVTSSVAILTVNPADVAPVITSQPTNQAVMAGQTVSFGASATGTPAPTFQWQVSTNGGTSWTNVSGATSSTLALVNATTAMSGNRYRVNVTNSAGTISSNVATLTVNSETVAPTITTQPVGRSVTTGQAATFSVVATGTPAPAFQWQMSTNGGSTWANISGATNASLTISDTTTAMNNNRFRVIVTNSAGNVTSNSATLTVVAPPEVSGNTLQLSVANASATPGEVVNVAVWVDVNPGIFSMQLRVGYDANILTPLSGAGNGGNLVPLVVGNVLPAAPAVFPVATANPLGIIFMDMNMVNSTNTGVLVTIPFRIRDNAPMGAMSEITVTVVEAFNENSVAVPTLVTSGHVTVASSMIWGDVNGDGAVTLADSILVMQHISQGSPLANQRAADVNHDGRITLADAILIMRHISQGVDLSP